MALDSGSVRASVLLDLAQWDAQTALLKQKVADVGDTLAKIPDVAPKVNTAPLEEGSKQVQTIGETISKALQQLTGGAINVDITGLQQAGAESESILATMSAGLLALPVAATAATAGLVALAGVGTKALFDLGAEFDVTLRKLSADTGAGVAQTEEFSAALRQLATAVPENLDVLGAQMAILRQRLGETDTELTGSVALFHDWSRATGQDAVQATQQLSQVFVAWRVAVEDQRQTLDGLKAIMEQTGVSAGVLQSGLAEIGAVARLAGFSIGETAAIVARFNQAGIDASAALFGLRRIIKEAADEGKPAREVFDEFIATMKGGAPETEKLAEAIKVLGTRGEVLFQAIKDGRFDIDTLTEAFDHAGGNVAAAAVKMTDASKALQDQWKEMQNAFIPVADALHLKFDEMAFAFLKSLNDMGAGIDKFLASQEVKDLVTFLAKQGAVPAVGAAQSAFGLPSVPGLGPTARGAGALAGAVGDVLNPPASGAGGSSFSAEPVKELTKAELDEAAAEQQAKEKAEEHTRAVLEAETAQARLVAGIVSGIGATTDWTGAINKVLAVMPLGTQATVEQIAAILDAKAATEELAKGEALHDTALAARIIQLHAWAAQTTDAAEAARLEAQAVQLTRDGLDAQAESEKQASKAKSEHARITEQLADLEANTYAKALDTVASGVLPALSAAEAQYVDALKIGKNTKEEAAFLAAKMGVSLDELNAHIAEGGEKLATWEKQQLAANRALADFVKDEDTSRISSGLLGLAKDVDSVTAAQIKQAEESGNTAKALDLLAGGLGLQSGVLHQWEADLKAGGAAAFAAREQIAELTTMVRNASGQIDIKVNVDIAAVQTQIHDLQQNFQEANTARAQAATDLAHTEQLATRDFQRQIEQIDQSTSNEIQSINQARHDSTAQFNADFAHVVEAENKALQTIESAERAAQTTFRDTMTTAQAQHDLAFATATKTYTDGLKAVQDQTAAAIEQVAKAQAAGLTQLSAAMTTFNQQQVQNAFNQSVALQNAQNAANSFTDTQSVASAIRSAQVQAEGAAGLAQQNQATALAQSQNSIAQQQVDAQKALTKATEDAAKQMQALSDDLKNAKIAADVQFGNAQAQADKALGIAQVGADFYNAQNQTTQTVQMRNGVPYIVQGTERAVGPGGETGTLLTDLLGIKPGGIEGTRNATEVAVRAETAAARDRYDGRTAQLNKHQAEVMANWQKALDAAHEAREEQVRHFLEQEKAQREAQTKADEQYARELHKLRVQEGILESIKALPQDTADAIAKKLHLGPEQLNFQNNQFVETGVDYVGSLVTNFSTHITGGGGG